MDYLTKLKSQRESRKKGIFCVMDNDSHEVHCANKLLQQGLIERVRHRQVSGKNESCSYTVYREVQDEK